MFGSFLGSTVDADAAYASRLRARLALEMDGLDADGLAVLRALRDEAGDEFLAAADDELLHRAVVTITEDYGTSVTPAKRAKKALDKLGKILSWRHEVRADSILHEHVPASSEFHEHWPVFLAGEDQHGHPIVYERVKDVNAEALLSAMDASDVTRHRVQIMEALHAHKRRKRLSSGALLGEKESHATKKGIHKHSWVIDLSGVSATGLLFTDTKRRSFLFALVELFSDKYPDTLHAMWLINAPSAFRAAWVTVKSALAKSTVEKISVVAADASRETLERKLRKGGMSGDAVELMCDVDRASDPSVVPGMVPAARLVENARRKSGLGKRSPPSSVRDANETLDSTRVEFVSRGAATRVLYF
jgi:hypothetical protein